MTAPGGLGEDIARIAGIPPSTVRGITPVAGGSICASYRVDLTDGRRLFAKQAPRGDTQMLQAEVAGLTWLAEAPAPTASIVGVDATLLVLAYVEPGPATPAAARQLGRDLAIMHAAGAESFGSPPPQAPQTGRIGSLELAYGNYRDWAEFYSELRLIPFMDSARRRGGLTSVEYDVLSELCRRLPDLAGPPVPVARIHGDLWAGNVMWAADGSAHLIDPAAHGGHPEADLAMLSLFGAPHWDAILDGYATVQVLPHGWHERIGLHQLHPLLVHAALFAGGYGRQAATIAASYLKRD